MRTKVLATSDLAGLVVGDATAEAVFANADWKFLLRPARNSLDKPIDDKVISLTEGGQCPSDPNEGRQLLDQGHNTLETSSPMLQHGGLHAD